MPQVTVTLAIDADTYQRFYAGGVRDVVATLADGRTLRFPAGILRHVVTHDGVNGRFVIRYSNEGKFTGIERA